MPSIVIAALAALTPKNNAGNSMKLRRLETPTAAAAAADALLVDEEFWRAIHTGDLVFDFRHAARTIYNYRGFTTPEADAAFALRLHQLRDLFISALIVTAQTGSGTT